MPPRGRTQLPRQIAHWLLAAERLADLDSFASPAAWAGLEQYLGLALRRALTDAVEALRAEGRRLAARAATAADGDLRADVLAFRDRYTQTEVVLDFYGDAVNTRTNPETGAMLRACDHLAWSSLNQALPALGHAVPPVLCYVDKGLGAAILKAGLRLWDGGTISPAAAIRVARHNLWRPTSLIHEAGHQFAHIAGWNEELAEVYRTELGAAPEVATTWAGWASEVAADAFAFVHLGYAAVATLHDVLAGDRQAVFSFGFGPHPVSYLRILLGVAMCRRAFGAGPWDDMEAEWRADNPLDGVPAPTRAVVEASLQVLPRIADVTVWRPMRGFNGRALAAIVDPARVAPAALARLEAERGGSLYVSMDSLRSEGLRLTALTGLRAAAEPARAHDHFQQQRAWMARLGGLDQRLAA
ncbi:MAG: hypothetical protein AB1918_04650 [Pseudomonadota bacterium]